jgi:8-oxo-dGTP diphosphatase
MPINLPVAVHAILKKNNKVLLLLRQNTGTNDGMWSLPAGRLEENETLPQATTREALEEVGVKINPDLLKNPLFMQHKNEKGERLYVFYLVDQWDGEPQNTEPEKCAKVDWFETDKLPAETLDHIVSAIKALEEGKSYVAYGF